MSDVQLSISQEVVKPIVEAKIQAAILSALSSEKDIIESAVEKILNVKVDSDGKTSTYSSSIPYLQWLTNNAIQSAAKAALQQYVEDQKPKIQAALKKAISMRIDDVCAQMMSCLIETTRDSYAVNVGVEFKQKKKSDW